MKKTFAIFGSIIIFLFIFLSIVDNSDYGLEKRLFRVQKQFNQAARDPRAVPDQKFDHIVEQYRKLIEKYPHSKEVPKIYMQMGMTYLLKQDIGKARTTFQEIINKFPENEEICTVALLNIGNTFESEKKEKEAIDIYEGILSKYPLTEVGLNMPLYMANYYLKVDQKEKSNEMIRRAVLFYKKISKENPQTLQEFNALRLLVTAYYAQENWREAVNTLGKILLDYGNKKYLTPQRANLIIKSINTVSITKVQDYHLPRDIYQKFMSQYPEHPLSKVLADMLNALKKLEEKGVIVGQKK